MGTSIPSGRSQPQLKIFDLGLALLRAEAVSPKEMTATGQVIGTADDMAPEQVTDSHGADFRADIYSLSGTLYKLLSGHAPFSDAKYGTPMKRLLGRLVESCPNLREITSETANGSLPVSALKRLRFLRRASLRGDQITDETVAMLVESPSLEHIELRSPVTDATLQRLPRFGGKLLSIRVSTPKPSSVALQGRAGSSDATLESQTTKATAPESHATLTAAGYAALLKLPDLVELQLDGHAGAPTDDLWSGSPNYLFCESSSSPHGVGPVGRLFA